MAGSRVATGIQWILLGLLLQLIVSLIAPGTRYPDYLALGINTPFELSFLTMPAVGVIIGALYLAGFSAIYTDRAERGEATSRRIRFALWLVVAAAVSSAAAVAIALRTRFETGLLWESWPALAVLDLSLAVSAGLAFLLTFYDLAKARGRGIALLATFLGAVGSILHYALNLSGFDLSIYAWILMTSSVGLFLFQAFNLRGAAQEMTMRATDLLGSPPAG